MKGELPGDMSPEIVAETGLHDDGTRPEDREKLKGSFQDLGKMPLGQLLEGGVHPDVFAKTPHTVGMRDLQHDMSSILHTVQGSREYRVLTHRGAPAFLLIPLDRAASTSLLAAAPPQTEYEVEKAHRREDQDDSLPDTTAVLASLADTPRPH